MIGNKHVSTRRDLDGVAEGFDEAERIPRLRVELHEPAFRSVRDVSRLCARPELSPHRPFQRDALNNR